MQAEADIDGPGRLSDLHHRNQHPEHVTQVLRGFVLIIEDSTTQIL